jgi:hypothetical protein
VGIVKKVVIGVPATLLAGFVGFVAWEVIDTPTYECGKGMHGRVMDVWNQDGQQQRMLEVWDDEAKDPIPDTLKGKVVISCVAKAAFSRGGDRYIRYAVTEERGSKWTRVNRGPAL